MNTPENQKTILLVEDDALIAMGEQMDLDAYGYAVIIAHTGEHAVEICRTNPTIDLILMDIDLGAGISGSEAAIQILKVRQLPLIFLSSHTDRDVFSQVEKIAFNGYIVKGSSVNVLVSSIKMAFRLFYVNLRLEAEKAYHEAILNSIGDVVIAANADT